MNDEKNKPESSDTEIQAALIDAELFMKYKAPERALKRLREAVDKWPHSMNLRETLRDYAKSAGYAGESARQCLSLARLYIDREEFDTAYDRLLEAKALDPRINIATGLDSIRRAKRPDLQKGEISREKRAATFAGDIALISIFDVIQVIENSRLTGILSVDAETHEGKIYFNAGRIVDAETKGVNGEQGFTKICEMISGLFDFIRTEQGFPIVVTATSNTNLILDTLRLIDEEKGKRNTGP